MRGPIEKKKQDFGTQVFIIHDLESLDREGLIAIWPDLAGGTPPRAMSQGLMRRFLAYELQARECGGLLASDLDRLERLTETRTRTSTTKMAAGARFLREWNGVTHVVERTESGYRWNGRVFGSLSAIAKEITGAHWSGPRFFGIGASAKATSAASRTPRSVRKGPAA